MPAIKSGEYLQAALAVSAGIVGLAATALYIHRIALLPLYITRAAIQHFGESRTEGSQGADQRLYYPDSQDDLGIILSSLNSLLDKQDESLEQQRRFVGSISHDIRTPLTIMRGDIEVALLRERTSEEYQKVLKSNLEEVERIGKLIEDLLTIARSDTGELGLRMRRVSLSNLLHEARKSHLPQAEDRGINVNLYIEEEIMIEGDSDRLRQLLDNLVENALHYTPGGGKIDIVLMRDENAARLVIRDTGVGIHPKDLPHIFEPFYRGRQPKEYGHHGYGLGLAICKFIVHAHDGIIFVESQVGPEESGTAFTILLPALTRTRE